MATTTIQSLTAEFGTDSMLKLLSSWEMTFLANVALREVKKSFNGFTPKQQNIVDKIHGKLDGTVLEPARQRVTGLMQVVEMMHTALLTIKYPKIKFELPGGKLQLSVAGPKAKHPGTINLTDGGTYGSNKWYGRIMVDGGWEVPNNCPESVKFMIATLGEGAISAVKEYGQKTANCCFCYKKLTQKESLEAGYGPVCAGNYGLPWGEG